MRRTTGSGRATPQQLEARLKEAESLIRAITAHEVDAFVIRKGANDQVLVLSGVERPYRLMVERMQQGALTTMADGSIMFVNRYFANLAGRDAGALLGTRFEELLEGSHFDCRRLLDQALVAEADIEMTLRRPDGTLVPVHVAASRLADERQNVLCLIVSDLSPRHQAEAERAALLNAVHDLARASQRALKLHSEPVDLRLLISEAIDRHRPEVEADGHVLASKIQDEPLPVVVDRQRIAQILGNLVDDALRGSRPGDTITITAERAWKDPTVAMVCISDSGPAVSAENMERLFEVFSSSSRSAGTDSLGVGLALARALSEAHGGSLEARPATAGGIEFVLRLPLGG